MQTRILIAALALLSPLAASAQSRVPVDVTVDTGTHTCVNPGQVERAYKTVYAGDSRYFIDVSLAEVSKLLIGSCEYASEGTGPAVEMRKFKFLDADGEAEWVEKPVRYTVRAFGDCTNNIGNVGKTVGTACRFTGTTKRGRE